MNVRFHHSRVTLRRPQPEDARALLAFGTSSEIFHMSGGDPRSVPEETPQRARRRIERLLAHLHAWIIESESQPVGEIRLDAIQEHDGRARLAVALFGDHLLGRGIGRIAIRKALDHAFGPLGLHRIDGRVVAYNERAIRCYRACGFVVEGRERQCVRVGDERHDDVIMGILSHEHLAGRA